MSKQMKSNIRKEYEFRKSPSQVQVNYSNPIKNNINYVCIGKHISSVASTNKAYYVLLGLEGQAFNILLKQAQPPEGDITGDYLMENVGSIYSGKTQRFELQPFMTRAKNIFLALQNFKGVKLSSEQSQILMCAYNNAFCVVYKGMQNEFDALSDSKRISALEELGYILNNYAYQYCLEYCDKKQKNLQSNIEIQK